MSWGGGGTESSFIQSGQLDSVSAARADEPVLCVETRRESCAQAAALRSRQEGAGRSRVPSDDQDKVRIPSLSRAADQTTVIPI
ncbi:hypothetical protein VZT92_001900 [Zoarces viviparus]|uniref:Uncharacterized protein n=1 Tax=Zoarces viviparus TaxID=48416 RepID=A0AAW1G402_ZOAVI